jgi:hypothetical protein
MKLSNLEVRCITIQSGCHYRFRQNGGSRVTLRLPYDYPTLSFQWALSGWRMTFSHNNGLICVAYVFAQWYTHVNLSVRPRRKNNAQQTADLLLCTG